MPRIPTPLRLTMEDFAALVPERGTGGGAARARLNLTSRMVRWSRSVARRLEDQEIAVRAVVPGLGAGIGKGAEPQKVLIQETGLRKNASVEPVARWALSLDDEGVHVALEINVSTKGASASLSASIREDDLRTSLLRLLEALPESFRFGLGGEPSISAAGAGALETAAWTALFEASATTGRPVCVGWDVARDVALLHADLLDEELEKAIVLLAPLYKLVTGKGDAAGRSGASNASNASKGRGARGPRAKPSRRFGVGGDADEAPLSLERGSRVRVLAGPFAGKVGVVKEVDGKGGAHVMLGLLATRIECKDLSASAAGRRPTLSSSHRKPLGLR